MQDFIHLHVHTYYSILDGMAPVSKLVDKAVANGMKGMALTDHGNMFGIKELFDYANSVNKKLKAEGKPPFKPIFGCEMYVARHNKEDMVRANGDLGGYHLIVLAKNFNGYKNLITLVSRAWVVITVAPVLTARIWRHITKTLSCALPASAARCRARFLMAT